MSTKRKGRKYQPGRAIALVMQRKDRAERLAKIMAEPIDAAQRTNIHAACSVAMKAICEGWSSKLHWAELAVGMNMALSLAELGYGVECIPEVNAALAAIFRAEQRGKTHDAWRLDGDGIKAMNNALEVLEAQLEIAPLADVQIAREAWKAKIRKGQTCQKEAA